MMGSHALAVVLLAVLGALTMFVVISVAATLQLLRSVARANLEVGGNTLEVRILIEPLWLHTGQALRLLASRTGVGFAACVVWGHLTGQDLVAEFADYYADELARSHRLHHWREGDPGDSE